MAKMTTEEIIVNDALSQWLGTNANGKWKKCFSTWHSIVWKDDAIDIPNESEYIAEKAAYEADQRAIHTRVYPSIQDQLDMQYHDKVDGTTTWQDAVKAVKDANPKA